MGFQGVSTSTRSRPSAAAPGHHGRRAAAALGADACEIYTDVEGVFTADPRVVPQAWKLHVVSYDEMLELVASGARVLMLRSVEFGAQPPCSSCTSARPSLEADGT